MKENDRLYRKKAIQDEMKDFFFFFCFSQALIYGCFCVQKIFLYKAVFDINFHIRVVNAPLYIVFTP